MRMEKLQYKSPDRLKENHNEDYYEDPEGMGEIDHFLGDYPIDDLLIRQESRTIHDVIRRIERSSYVMDPDFQRDFIWDESKQSKLIESVVMRIPLPVFYLAENDDGKMVVVDGLQRLSTFSRFVDNKLKLKLPNRVELKGKKFQDLTAKLQNRVEDCNLIFYIIDSKAPEQVRLDIFERVNGGEPLTRQQMRNSLYMGHGTRFLKEHAKSAVFLEATDGRLNTKTMRDREFVNRFCAFKMFGVDKYSGDMDQFLADCLVEMNKMDEGERSSLSNQLHRSLKNNLKLYGKSAFRKPRPESEPRSVINASLWDVLSTGLSHYDESLVQSSRNNLKESINTLLHDEEFNAAISHSTNDKKKVTLRFKKMFAMLKDNLGDFQT